MKMINHLAIYLQRSIEALDASGASGPKPVVAQDPSGEAPTVATDPLHLAYLHTGVTS